MLTRSFFIHRAAPLTLKTLWLDEPPPALDIFSVFWQLISVPLRTSPKTTHTARLTTIEEFIVVSL